ncbi:pyridoxal phosphate-dependent aminotransferase family protein [Streptomyces sp. UNOC14_S4]|uniref:aminotransferase class I/II-fold pyridoxal phosphate-dependent enzyme n=1 Tax=Streptomyces sp. UNOC14_S4 TaxID=2872340 RepID=UPI001E590C05|nr:pyridoxal phosphate-dependent aminotransferase family protein [Streptomyces sp. UNOC14_S4]MCC3766195.1 pyridoxal phosphate-dependent aminotransferase family protein [Streptomyces sp. UNOC14_S4]
MDIVGRCASFTRSRQARDLGLYPFYSAFSGRGPGAVRTVGGREVVVCGSGDYLGLAADPRVTEAAAEASRRYGTGPSGSRLLNGNLDLHERLEAELARFFGKPAALVFATGYQAGLGAVAGLCRVGDHVFVDQEAHASLVDAARLSRAKVHWFPHNDTDRLATELEALPGNGGRMVVVDGVYSMRGDLCPLPDLVRVCREHRATLVVDDAHGAGVLAEGRGTCARYGLTDDVPVIILTFSKAFASIGGAVLGDETVIEYLRHYARPLVFSAGASPADTAAALQALRILCDEPRRCRAALDNARRMRHALSALGYRVPPGETPLVPVDMGDELRTAVAWRLLLNRGVHVNAVLPPAAPACLRATFCASHTAEQLDAIATAFADIREPLAAVAVPETGPAASHASHLRLPRTEESAETRLAGIRRLLP